MNRYDKYKLSGIDWIEEIPFNWSIYKLRYLGFFSSSGIDKKIIENEQVIKIVNYTDVYSNNSHVLNSSFNFMEVTCPSDKIFKHKLIKGDLIFTPSSETIEDIGISAVVDEELENTCYSYHVLRFRIEKPIDHNYRKYLCNNHFVLNQFSSNARGTTRQTLNREDFNNTLVVLPSLAEQSAIANYLDNKTKQIDDLIQKKQNLIDLLNEERTALINQAVTKGLNSKVKLKSSGIELLGDIPEHWEVKKLKWLVKVRNEEISECDFKFAVENIESKTGKLINLNSELKYEGNLNKFNKSDIIFNKLRPYLHKVYFAERDGGVYGELIIMTSLGEIIPEYLYFILFSDSFIALVNGNTQGTKMPRANWDGFINQIQITYPKSQKEQKEIVEGINRITRKNEIIIKKYSREIELLQEYRTTLINEVVTGKVKVI